MTKNKRKKKKMFSALQFNELYNLMNACRNKLPNCLNYSCIALDKLRLT